MVPALCSRAVSREPAERGARDHEQGGDGGAEGDVLAEHQCCPDEAHHRLHKLNLADAGDAAEGEAAIPGKNPISIETEPR